MVEESKAALNEIASDPNFLMILAGAVIWFLGYYVLFVSPLFLSTGFVLVCFAAAINSLKRPVAQAWPGLLIGGLLQIIGYYLAWIPIIGPALIVIGGVAIVYFALPLALQRGELPVITRLQELIDSKKDKEKIVDIEVEEPANEEAVDAQEDSGEN